MRHWMIGFGLMAIAAEASAQDGASSWRYFEPEGAPIQAGVIAEDGSQLILKCDAPGMGSVYVVVVTPDTLVPASQNPFLLPTEIRFDQRAPLEDRWRFSDKSAVAIDARGQLALSRFMDGLPSASKLRIRMYLERGRTVELNFDVAGARDAINRVYESCKDDVPS